MTTKNVKKYIQSIQEDHRQETDKYSLLDASSIQATLYITRPYKQRVTQVKSVTGECTKALVSITTKAHSITASQVTKITSTVTTVLSVVHFSSEVPLHSKTICCHIQQVPHHAQVQKLCYSRNQAVAYPAIQKQPPPPRIGNCNTIFNCNFCLLYIICAKKAHARMHARTHTH
jgi:hypothetical protein